MRGSHRESARERYVPVPAPIQAMGAFGCLGASCKHRHSVASSRVSKPYPNATKSFTNNTRLIRNSVAMRSPSISQLSRLVNRTEREDVMGRELVVLAGYVIVCVPSLSFVYVELLLYRY